MNRRLIYIAGALSGAALLAAEPAFAHKSPFGAEENIISVFCWLWAAVYLVTIVIKILNKIWRSKNADNAKPVKPLREVWLFLFSALALCVYPFVRAFYQSGPTDLGPTPDNMVTGRWTGFAIILVLLLFPWVMMISLKTFQYCKRQAKIFLVFFALFAAAGAIFTFYVVCSGNGTC